MEISTLSVLLPKRISRSILPWITIVPDTFLSCQSPISSKNEAPCIVFCWSPEPESSTSISHFPPALVRLPRMILVPLAMAGYRSIAGVNSYLIVSPAARTVILSVPFAENKPKLYFDII